MREALPDEIWYWNGKLARNFPLSTLLQFFLWESGFSEFVLSFSYFFKKIEFVFQEKLMIALTIPGKTFRASRFSLLCHQRVLLLLAAFEVFNYRWESGETRDLCQKLTYFLEIWYILQKLCQSPTHEEKFAFQFNQKFQLDDQRNSSSNVAHESQRSPTPTTRHISPAEMYDENYFHD